MSPAAPLEAGDRTATAGRGRRAERVLDWVTIACLPALMIYLGLNAGGYFALETGWAATALAAMLALRVAVSGGPLAARSRPLALAAAALAMLAIWTLLSGEWSGNRGRALLEFDRTLLFLLVLLVFASIREPRSAMRRLPPAFVFAAAFLCAVGFVTRTLPDLLPSEAPADAGKLAYPLTYSNGLGILASLALVLGLHLASSQREPAAIRILAAAALPLLAATLALTQSEGAVVAGVAGVVLYVGLGRPGGLVAALVAGVPFTFLAGDAAVGAELLATGDPATATATAQGHELARTVGVAMAGAGMALAVLLRVERRLTRGTWRSPPRAVGVIAAALAIAVAATQLPDAVRAVGDELEGTGSAQVGSGEGVLRVLDGQNRIAYWRVAFGAFEEKPIIGTGAGSFGERWARDRPFPERVDEAHSVYLETLGELGLVGAALLLLTLAMLTLAFVCCSRRVERSLGAAALGACGAWLLHAGIDWDWELPVVTIWLFAFGGCALAGWSKPRVGGRIRSRLVRTLGVAACLLAVVTPVTVALSQARLDGAVSALLREDCNEADRLAAAASRVLPIRAEPYELLAYCASRQGAHGRAISMMKRALDRDPESWELVYGLALVQGAAGDDPRPAARRALALSPLEPIANAAIERFSADDPHSWRRQARAAPLPLP